MVEEADDPPGLHWAPLRHHSPQCAWQLRRLIESIRPDQILLEGPSEAEQLLPYIQDSQAQPPLAVYLYARGSVTTSETKGHFRAFFPLAAMSPEFVALRTAKRLGIPAHFIDLPYRLRLGLSTQPQAHQHAQENLLNDDHLIAGAKPMEYLIRQSNCRDFDEWWERHFESGVQYSEPEAFFAQLQRLGLLLRQGDEAPDAETLARESWMADQLRPHLDAGKRSLVVCGAYHCAGIKQFLETPQPPPVEPDSLDGGVHLVPYSLARLNRASGYAAGMPDSGYYAAVWKKLSRRRKWCDPFQEVHRELSLTLTRHLRDQNYPVTFPDAVEVNLMAKRLADLRGYLPGRNELRDAIDSCLLKQARDGTEQAFQHQVDRFLAGSATGSLPGQMPVSPLVEEFRHRGRQFRWPLSATEPREKGLNIYRRAGHREQSRTLHQLLFLGVPYAELIAGPRFSAGKDLARVREIWRIEWHPESEARLTECSHYGSTLDDAVLNCLLERLNDPASRGPELVSLFIDALAMGLHDILEPVLATVIDWLRHETELIPLCHGLKQLGLAYFAHSALTSQGLPGLEQALSNCFERICVRLPWVGQLSDEQADSLCDAMASMHSFVVSDFPGCPPELFHDALAELLVQANLSQLKGVCCAILWVADQIDIPVVTQIFIDLFGEASLSADNAGGFLQGFLRVARGRLAQEPELLELITSRFLAWDETEFLEVLPALRLAFTQLSPRETQQLANQLAADSGYELTTELTWSHHDLLRANALHQELLEISCLWGVR